MEQLHLTLTGAVRDTGQSLNSCGVISKGLTIDNTIKVGSYCDRIKA